MATISFYLGGSRKNSMIYIRLRDGRECDLKAPTGLLVEHKFWSKEKHWLKPKSEFQGRINLENKLKKMEALVFERRNDRISDRLGLNLTWLKDVLSEVTSHYASTGNELIGLIEGYKTRLESTHKNGRKISSGTLRNYNTTMGRLKKYQLHTGAKLTLMDIDLKFHTAYMEYAQTNLKLSINSIGNDFKHIKTVCIDSMDNGLEVNPIAISRKFNSPTEKSLFTTLNEGELNRIKVVRGSDYLTNARDWLVIGCWTGCRVGDLMNLSSENIFKHNSDTRVLKYTQSKTGKLVTVPLHPDVLEIIDRLSGFPRSISSVKFNKYIKEVCKAANISEVIEGSRQNPKTHRKETGKFKKWELIRSHTCRRSFATNHYNKLPNKIIMAVTGHSTEKMLLQYIGETETQHIDEFLNLWSN